MNTNYALKELERQSAELKKEIQAFEAKEESILVHLNEVNEEMLDIEIRLTDLRREQDTVLPLKDQAILLLETQIEAIKHDASRVNEIRQAARRDNRREATAEADREYEELKSKLKPLKSDLDNARYELNLKQQEYKQLSALRLMTLGSINDLQGDLKSARQEKHRLGSELDAINIQIYSLREVASVQPKAEPAIYLNND